MNALWFFLLLLLSCTKGDKAREAKVPGGKILIQPTPTNMQTSAGSTDDRTELLMIQYNLEGVYWLPANRNHPIRPINEGQHP